VTSNINNHAFTIPKILLASRNSFFVGFLRESLPRLYLTGLEDLTITFLLPFDKFWRLQGLLRPFFCERLFLLSGIRKVGIGIYSFVY